MKKFDWNKAAAEFGEVATITRFDLQKYEDLAEVSLSIGGQDGYAVASKNIFFKPLLGTSMKVIIDRREDGWVLVYPNEDTHPKEKRPELSAELLEYSRKIKA